MYAIDNVRGLRYIDDVAIWRLDNDHDGNFTDVTDEHYYILSDVQFSTGSGDR